MRPISFSLWYCASFVHADTSRGKDKRQDERIVYCEIVKSSIVYLVETMTNHNSCCTHDMSHISKLVVVKTAAMIQYRTKILLIKF